MVLCFDILLHRPNYSSIRYYIKWIPLYYMYLLITFQITTHIGLHEKRNLILGYMIGSLCLIGKVHWVFLGLNCHLLVPYQLPWHGTLSLFGASLSVCLSASHTSDFFRQTSLNLGCQFILRIVTDMFNFGCSRHYLQELCLFGICLGR